VRKQLEARVKELQAQNAELKHDMELAAAADGREKKVAAKLSDLQQHLNKESMAALEQDTRKAEEEKAAMLAKLQNRNKEIAELERRKAKVLQDQASRTKQYRALLGKEDTLGTLNKELMREDAKNQKLRKTVKDLANRLTSMRANRLFSSDMKLETSVKSEHDGNELLWKQNLQIQKGNLDFEAKSGENLAAYAAKVKRLAANKTELLGRNQVLDEEISFQKKNLTALEQEEAVVGKERAALLSRLMKYKGLKKEMAAQAAQKTRLQQIVAKLQQRLSTARAQLLFDGSSKTRQAVASDAMRNKELLQEDENLATQTKKMKEKYEEELAAEGKLKKKLKRFLANGGDDRARVQLRSMVQAKEGMANENEELQGEVGLLEKKLKQAEDEGVALDAEKEGVEEVVQPPQPEEASSPEGDQEPDQSQDQSQDPTLPQDESQDQNQGPEGGSD